MKMDKNKTAILGGSFDPVHKGHLFLLHQAVSLSPYRRFIIVPAALSNFKQDSRPVTQMQDRLNMIKLAIEDYKDLYPEDDAQIIISDTELKRGGVSYTYDTVIQIKQQYSIEDKLGLIIGDDHIRKLEEWYRFDQLKDEVEFIICPRNENPDVFNLIPETVSFIKLRTTSVAFENATAIRNNLSDNQNYLSNRVLEYVRKNRLYS